MAVRFSTIHRRDFYPSVNPPSESFRCFVSAIQTSLIAFDLIAALYLPRSDDKWGFIVKSTHLHHIPYSPEWEIP